MSERAVFVVSDSTGTTAGALSKLLEHFPNTEFSISRMPFTDNLEKLKPRKQVFSLPRKVATASLL